LLFIRIFSHFTFFFLWKYLGKRVFNHWIVFYIFQFNCSFWYLL
jgi:hypothetical protein